MFTTASMASTSWVATLTSLSQAELARDEVAQDLVGSLTERVQARVAPVALHVALHRVAGAGEDLHAVVGDELERLRGHHLGLGRLAPARAPAPDQPGQMIGHEPRLVDARLHVREAVAQHLELADGPPELAALARVREGEIDGGLGAAGHG